MVLVLCQNGHHSGNSNFVGNYAWKGNRNVLQFFVTTLPVTRSELRAPESRALSTRSQVVSALSNVLCSSVAQGASSSGKKHFSSCHGASSS